MISYRIRGKQWKAMCSTVEKFLEWKMICELKFVD